MLSALFASPYIPTEFSDFSGGLMQKLNLIGIDFNRNPALATVPLIRRPSLHPSSLV